MRKIISKEDKRKKKKRNQLIIGIILVVVMFFSVLGSSVNREGDDKTEKIKYNGIDFTKESGLWNAKISNLQFSFVYNPQETGKINSSLNKLEDYAGKPLYIYSENRETLTEIYRNLFYQNLIAQRVQEACIWEEKCEGDFPIKTCSDNFIIIKESENSQIYQQENCVFIEGKKEDLVRLADSFLFKIIGVQ